jgi:hypothetical protein
VQNIEITVFQPPHLTGLHLINFRHPDLMTPRPSRDTLDSLRVTLQKLEQTTDATSNRQDIAELKQILLNRIAELETLNMLDPQEAVPASASSDLPPLAAVTEKDRITESAEARSPEKLD